MTNKYYNKILFKQFVKWYLCGILFSVTIYYIAGRLAA